MEDDARTVLVKLDSLYLLCLQGHHFPCHLYNPCMHVEVLAVLVSCRACLLGNINKLLPTIAILRILLAVSYALSQLVPAGKLCLGERSLAHICFLGADDAVANAL